MPDEKKNLHRLSDFWFGICIIGIVVGVFGGAVIGISQWLSLHAAHLSTTP